MRTAPPDGYTLLLATCAMIAIYPWVYRNLNYDPLKDFMHIVNAASFELAMNAHPGVQANNLKEFIDWAKSQEGKLSFASYGQGTPSHFLGEMLNQAAGLHMTHVPHRGSPPARQDLTGGQIPVFFDTVGGTVMYFRAGRAKVYATSGLKRSPFLPDVPTFVELGYKDMIASAWFAFVVPRGLPEAVAQKLNQAFNRAIASREVRQQFLANGMYPLGGTSQELFATIKSDMARWEKAVKASGFQAQRLSLPPKEKARRAPA
ncbi:MAG: tripartite tricarboxylate transporter substrate binding protein [Candidatus Protistobacter heckmanni]|nr:tripartite tricarboxylate transporter substrate binding protein [Candidatus Protistobacter heckmanni]